MTREEAAEKINWLYYEANYGNNLPDDMETAIDMAIKALKEPKARCSNCDFLKSCMHAWDIDCGCEFYQVGGVRHWEEEQ